MSAARKTFYSRIGTIRSAISDFGLRDLPPIPSNNAHNSSVRVIRNGLAIQTFNTLEDFIKARTREALRLISDSGVQFSDLPERLQKASTIDVISAIQFQLKLQDISGKVAYTQDHSIRIGTTVNPPLDLPEIAFFHSSSNISPDHYRDSLKAFSIKNPWTQIGGFISRIGVSAVAGETLFRELAKTRHEAAHDPTANVSEVDLKQALRDATSLAAGFDILLSYCLRSIIVLSAQPSAHILTDHNAIPVRFIKYSNPRFGEIREGGHRVFRTATTPVTLIPGARARAGREHGALVVFDASGNLTSWELP